ncbi:MAG: acyl-CoA thioesterase [Spirochaetaceae bacterium]|jgi:acyl-CoA thioester hydrolase|nr:acyl-CoA thioesterase [Spirochaetaceae bacterium]
MVSERNIRVRTYECDSNGHVNNANYLNYLEYARFEFLRDIGFDYKRMMEAGYGIYVVRVEIDYKHPAMMDDEILISSWPVKKGAASGVIAQKILRGDDVIVEAKVTWAFVDGKGSPTRLPPEFDVPLLAPESPAG